MVSPATATTRLMNGSDSRQIHYQGYMHDVLANPRVLDKVAVFKQVLSVVSGDDKDGVVKQMLSLDVLIYFSDLLVHNTEGCTVLRDQIACCFCLMGDLCRCQLFVGIGMTQVFDQI